MSGLTKLIILLTSISSLFFFAFLAEILCLIHRRRRLSNIPTAAELAATSTAEKSRLFRFSMCWKKNQVQVEPAASGGPENESSVQELPEISLEISEMMKLHGIYGPSRVLFTIKEEAEKEEIGESERSSLGLGERKIAESEEAAVLAENSNCFELDKITPFSTPCSSPPYYTPSASPCRM